MTVAPVGSPAQAAPGPSLPHQVWELCYSRPSAPTDGEVSSDLLLSLGLSLPHPCFLLLSASHLHHPPPFLWSCCLVLTKLHQHFPASFSLRNSTSCIRTQRTTWMEAKTRRLSSQNRNHQVHCPCMLASLPTWDSHLELNSYFTRDLNIISYQVSRYHILKQHIISAS